MLFNSYQFIFVFLPLAFAAYQVVRRWSIPGALTCLIFASALFYAWWRPINVLILLPSILIDYGLARVMVSASGARVGPFSRRMVLVVGIVLNLVFLGYFKYLTFFQTASNDLIGTDFVLHNIVLPLAISFITFQKIAFLVDVYGRQIKDFRFREYLLFILFFPQLIAGPIVHFNEMIPQFRALSRRPDVGLIAVGVTLFCMGLFKKVILADNIAAYVSPLFASTAEGNPISLLTGWMGALGFTFQIYFDFSAYSDMAAGLALMIGVRLPMNFDSPLKASNIIDFWSRWHITLTRFLTAYVYNPLALKFTRWRARRRLPGLSPANPDPVAYLHLIALPTLVTMSLSGLWHGAGYTFIVWGTLHGIYLCVNHAWRLLVANRVKDKESYDRRMRLPGLVLTFTAVVVTMVWFKAPDASTALKFLEAMVGAHGIGLPAQLAGLPVVENLPGIHADAMSLTTFASFASLLLCLALIALLMPNTHQLLESQSPVLHYVARDDLGREIASRISWQTSLPWLTSIAACFATVVMMLSGPSEFLYWQF